VGRSVTPDPLPIQAVPRNPLGPPVASLADDAGASSIIAAIDEAISRSHG
jgi:hypothetical protein